MTNASATERFIHDLPCLESLDRAGEPSAYRPIPDDWSLAVTDVVRSRVAIAEGRFKAVNMAGAAPIAALMNALSVRTLPFAFGGDGAVAAVAPEDADAAREALAETARWAEEELGLALRTALVPIAAIRAAGQDVRAARIRLSDAGTIYAFAGGGIAFAEERMKAGAFAVPPAPSGTRPDLAGLSCRWAPMRARGRVVVSLIVEAAPGHEETFPAIAAEVLALVGKAERGGHPMPEDGPPLVWPPAGLDLEARARRGNRSLGLTRARLVFETLFAWVVLKAGRRLRGFDPRRYRRYTVLNTDDRKFVDGLRITASLDPAALDRLTARLASWRRKGFVAFGLAEQDAAVITCFVPQVTADDHLHFLDGAGGGYAEAAARLEAAKAEDQAAASSCAL